MNEFLAALSLFDNPELDFQDKFVMMGNEGSRKSLKYWYSDPVVHNVQKKLPCQQCEVNFNFSDKDYLILQRQLLLLVCLIWYWRMEVLESPTRKNDTANHFAMEIDYIKMDHETHVL